MEQLEKEHLDQAVRELQENLGCFQSGAVGTITIHINNYYSGPVTIQPQQDD